MVPSIATDPLRRHPDLSDEDRSWLQMLVGDWQLVADLSLADFVLWAPLPRPHADSGYMALAQTRPVTAPTLFHRDIVGSRARADLRTLLDRVWHDGEPPEGTGPVAAPDGTLRVRLWPVVRQGRVVAVLSGHRDPNTRPELSPIERNYGTAADSLLDMVQHGRWPDPQDPPAFWIGGTPRVGDGLMVLDAEGVVGFASPNAVSALTRLGVTASVEGNAMAPVVTGLASAPGPMDEDMWSVLMGRRSGRTEVQVGRSVVTVRAIRLCDADGRTGSLVMLRDVTELRRQEQRLMSKDATIREIHHRVKNNLQTVGSLLRMQARRAGSDEARRALMQAMQRVDTIALVHQSLSEDVDGQVDVDDLMSRQFRLAVEISGDGRPLTTQITGEFGRLPSHVTTPLALVLNELASNAVEHGTGPDGGVLRLHAGRVETPAGEVLEVSVSDSGVAARTDVQGRVPGVSSPGDEAADAVLADLASSGLGLKIVHTLVESDLGGTLERTRRPGGGMRVTLRIPVG